MREFSQQKYNVTIDATLTLTVEADSPEDAAQAVRDVFGVRQADAVNVEVYPEG